MARRIGFYFPRDNHLKVIGPVVDYLLRHRAGEFEVVFLVAQWPIGKAVLQTQVDRLGELWGDRVEVLRLPDVSALRTLMARGAFDAFVNVSPSVLGISADELRSLREASHQANIKWAALPYIFSQDYQLIKNLETAVDTWDLICTLGPRSIQYIESQLGAVPPATASAVRDRLKVTGSTELDGVAGMGDTGAIRRKYGLPEGKPIVYVSTAPALYPSVTSSRMARGLTTRFEGRHEWSVRGLLARGISSSYPVLVPYRTYLSALRAFADANGAILIGKTREKHHDPALVHDYLDEVFGDRDYYPFTTLELLRTSSLYFGFYSASVIEAAGVGVYAISSMFLPPEVVEPVLPAYRAWSEDLLWGSNGFWNQAGVSEVMHGTSPLTYAALDRLAHASLADYAVDPLRRQIVLDQFASHVGSGSARFADAMASLMTA